MFRPSIVEASELRVSSQSCRCETVVLWPERRGEGKAPRNGFRTEAFCAVPSGRY